MGTARDAAPVHGRVEAWWFLVRLTGDPALASGLDERPLRDAVRVARRRLRVDRARRLALAAVGLDRAPAVLDPELSAGRQRLADELGRLPFRPKAVVLLADAWGLPVEAIAAIMRMEVLHVLRDLDDARGRLRTALFLPLGSATGADPVLGPALRSLRGAVPPVLARVPARAAGSVVRPA